MLKKVVKLKKSLLCTTFVTALVCICSVSSQSVIANSEDMMYIDTGDVQAKTLPYYESESNLPFTASISVDGTKTVTYASVEDEETKRAKIEKALVEFNEKYGADYKLASKEQREAIGEDAESEYRIMLEMNEEELEEYFYCIYENAKKWE